MRAAAFTIRRRAGAGLRMARRRVHLAGTKPVVGGRRRVAGQADTQPQSLVVPDKAATDGDVRIAERLLAAYRTACRTRDDPVPPADREDMWTMIVGQQRRFASVLDRGDARELATYLCNVSRHDAARGITQGDLEFQRIASARAYRDLVARMALDKLVLLAEGVGARPVENPEQAGPPANLASELGAIVASISVRVGVDIAPPEIDGGLLKVDTGRGLFHERDANAIYTAYLMRQLASGVPIRICEIGGGSGRVAYWSRRFGMTAYTIVDLPHVNVVQGFYALKALPADEVVLYGEAPPGSSSGRLQILPAHAIHQLRLPLYDLVLNQDSFPEMNAGTVTDYLRWIRASCSGSLLSINHESKPPYGAGLAHISVPEMVAAAGGFKLTYRFPYWLRRGYVLERYDVL